MGIQIRIERLIQEIYNFVNHLFSSEDKLRRSNFESLKHQIINKISNLEGKVSRMKRKIDEMEDHYRTEIRIKEEKIKLLESEIERLKVEDPSLKHD